MSKPNPSYASKDTRNASQHMLNKPIPCKQDHKMHLNLWWTNSSHDIWVTKCISTCVCQSSLMLERKQNISQDVFNKKYHASNETKCHSTCVHQMHSLLRGHKLYIWNFVVQTPLKPANTENVSQLVLTKLLSSPWGRKMYLKMCFQSHPMPGRTLNV